MYEEPSLAEVKQRIEEERQPCDSLRQQVERTGDPQLMVRLARACVRAGQVTEGLGHYDHAELMGYDGAHAERRVVAMHPGDFPQP